MTKDELARLRNRKANEHLRRIVGVRPRRRKWDSNDDLRLLMGKPPAPDLHPNSVKTLAEPPDDAA